MTPSINFQIGGITYSPSLDGVEKTTQKTWKQLLHDGEKQCLPYYLIKATISSTEKGPEVEFTDGSTAELQAKPDELNSKTCYFAMPILRLNKELVISHPFSLTVHMNCLDPSKLPPEINQALKKALKLCSENNEKEIIEVVENQIIVRDFFYAQNHVEKVAFNEAIARNLEKLYDIAISYQKNNLLLAHQLLQLISRLGYKKATLMLGIIYFSGFGVKKDDDKADHYFGAFISQGGTYKEIGDSLLGAKLGIDLKKVYYFYQKDPKNCLLELGFLYTSGIGVEQDLEVANDYFNAAVAKDRNPLLTMLTIARTFREGNNIWGIEKDLATAKKWLIDCLENCKDGVSEACLELGELYLELKDINAAHDCFKNYIKMKENDINAIFEIYEIFREYNLDKEAREYYEKALQKSRLMPNGNLSSLSLGGESSSINSSSSSLSLSLSKKRLRDKDDEKGSSNRPRKS